MIAYKSLESIVTNVAPMVETVEVISPAYNFKTGR